MRLRIGALEPTAKGAGTPVAEFNSVTRSPTDRVVWPIFRRPGISEFDRMYTYPAIRRILNGFLQAGHLTSFDGSEIVTVTVFPQFVQEHVNSTAIDLLEFYRPAPSPFSAVHPPEPSPARIPRRYADVSLMATEAASIRHQPLHAVPFG